MDSRKDWLVFATIVFLSVVVGLISSVVFLESFRESPSLSQFFVDLLALPPVSWGEFVGFITGVAAVYLVTKQSILAWPIGIVMVIVYTWVYYEYKLFGDMGLMQVYLVLQIHGWWSWLHGGKDKSSLIVSWASKAVIAFTTLFVIAGTWAATPLLVWLKGAAPFWDSFTTVASLAAQYHLNRKLISNWIIWIIVDIVYVPLYWSREMYATSVLYAFFLVLASVGLAQWLKAFKSGEAVA